MRLIFKCITLLISIWNEWYLWSLLGLGRSLSLERLMRRRNDLSGWGWLFVRRTCLFFEIKSLCGDFLWAESVRDLMERSWLSVSWNWRDGWRGLLIDIGFIGIVFFRVLSWPILRALLWWVKLKLCLVGSRGLHRNRRRKPWNWIFFLQLCKFYSTVHWRLVLLGRLVGSISTIWVSSLPMGDQTWLRWLRLQNYTWVFTRCSIHSRSLVSIYLVLPALG